MSNIAISERQKWIGSSEVAALLGVSPFTTRYELFHEKTGRIERPDLDNVERVQAGRFLEPAIAEWAAHKWGWPVRKVADYRPHPTVAGFGVSCDFETEAGDVVEIKCVDYLVFRDKWTVEGEDLVDAPDHYVCQVAAQLACSPAAKRGWLVACVGGNKLYRLQIDRHPGLIAKLEREVEAFWQAVRDGREPLPDFKADGETISLLYDRGRGGAVDLSGSNSVIAACADYVAAKADEKSAKARADAAMAEIRHAIGDASAAIVPGFKISISDIAEADVPATTRRAYRRLLVKQQKAA